MKTAVACTTAAITDTTAILGYLWIGWWIVLVVTLLPAMFAAGLWARGQR